MEDKSVPISPIVGDVTNYRVSKISARDTNKFVLLCDTTTTPLPFMMCVEIFDVGGSTPVNRHEFAFEHFYVLSGYGVARVGDYEFRLSPGCHLLVPPQMDHLIQNTGSTKLYVLTTMVPDEGFSTLIHSGVESSLDDQDIQILKRLSTVT